MATSDLFADMPAADTAPPVTGAMGDLFADMPAADEGAPAPATMEPTSDLFADMPAAGPIAPAPASPSPALAAIQKQAGAIKPSLIKQPQVTGTPPTPPPASVTPAGGGVPPSTTGTIDERFNARLRQQQELARTLPEGSHEQLKAAENVQDMIQRRDATQGKAMFEIPTATKVGAAMLAPGQTAAYLLAEKARGKPFEYEAQPFEQAVAPVQNQLQQTVGGITFGLSDIVLDKMRQNYGVEYQPGTTSEQVINSLGRMMGGVFTAQGLSTGLGTLTKDLGMQGMKQALLTRLGTAGISSTVNSISNLATDKRNLKEASGDIAQNMAAALLGFGAETYVPPGVKNFVAQVGTDLVFDILTDGMARGRIKDKGFQDWFIQEELPQLFMSIAFATGDNVPSNRAEFKAQQRRIKAEVRQSYESRFKGAKTKGILDLSDTAEMARAVDIGRATTEAKRVTADFKKQKYADLLAAARAEGVVGKKETPSRTDMANRLSAKVMEDARTNPAKMLASGDKDAENFLKGMNENRKKREELAKKRSRSFLERFKSAWIDEQSTVKKELERAGAEEVSKKLVLSQGASAEANAQFKAAEKAIDSALDGAPEDMLSKYIHARRTVEATRIARERGTELKSPDLIGEKESQAFLDRFETEGDPEIRARVKAAADEYDKVMSNSLDELLEAGLISKEAHAKLKEEHKSYSPRIFIDNVDPATSGIKGERSHDSGVKALSEGSDKAMVDDYKQLMAHVISRTQSRVFRNRANAELAKFARSDTESPFRIRKQITETQPAERIIEGQKLQSPDGQKATVLKVNPNNTTDLEVVNPDGRRIIEVLRDEDVARRFPTTTVKGEPIGRGEGVIKAFVDGNEVEIVAPKQLADEYNGMPPVMHEDFARALSLASGSKLLKTIATGVNPEFAFRNFFRDMAYAWFNSGQYSRFGIGALAQQIVDYSEVLGQAFRAKGIRNSQEYKDYVKQGGGLDYLATQGQLARRGIEGAVKETTAKKGIVGKAISARQELANAVNKAKTTAEKVGEVLSWLGETSEIATRLAVRNRAIKNGLSPEDATFAARNMLDFAQGGRYSKAAENAIPYLNAAIQGTRGGFRAFKTDRVGSTAKAAQLAATGYALATAGYMLAPDLWNSISDEEKARKWIIPLPVTKTDKNGKRRPMYIAIPKDQFQQVFSAIGGSWADGQNGQPWSKKTMEAVKGQIPVDAATLVPPSVNAMMTYLFNYDTWRNDEVWKGDPNTPSNLERTVYTPELANKISDQAKKMGVEISPERLVAATSKVIPTSNPIASMMVNTFDMPLGEKEQRNIVSTIRSIPALRSFVRFGLEIDPKAKTLEEARRFRIDPTGKIDQQVVREIKESKRDVAGTRAKLNLELDRFLRTNPSKSEIGKWVRENAPNGTEAKRLQQRIKDKKPELLRSSK